MRDRLTAQKLAKLIVKTFFPDMAHTGEIKRLRQQILRDSSLRPLPGQGHGSYGRYGVADAYQWIARTYPERAHDVQFTGPVLTSAPPLMEPLGVRFGLIGTGTKLHTDIGKANAEIQRLRKHKARLQLLLQQYRRKAR